MKYTEYLIRKIKRIKYLIRKNKNEDNSPKIPKCLRHLTAEESEKLSNIMMEQRFPDRHKRSNFCIRMLVFLDLDQSKFVVFEKFDWVIPYEHPNALWFELGENGFWEFYKSGDYKKMMLSKEEIQELMDKVSNNLKYKETIRNDIIDLIGFINDIEKEIDKIRQNITTKPFDIRIGGETEYDCKFVIKVDGTTKLNMLEKYVGAGGHPQVHRYENHFGERIHSWLCEKQTPAKGKGTIDEFALKIVLKTSHGFYYRDKGEWFKD